jgi:hypothetical protein
MAGRVRVGGEMAKGTTPKGCPYGGAGTMSSRWTAYSVKIRLKPQRSIPNDVDALR